MKKIMRITAVMMAVCMIFLSGCSFKHTITDKVYASDNLTENVTGTVTDPDYEPGEEYNEAMADLFIKMFQENIVLEDNEGKNVMISPMSIAMALCMTANGATDETREEFTKLFGMDPEELSKAFKVRVDNYTNVGKIFEKAPDTEINFANSVWFRKGEIEVKQKFLEQCVGYFGADVFEGAFDDITVNDINRWVQRSTNQMIDKIIEQLTPDEVMVLINAIAFEGKWEEPYEEYQVKDDEFTTEDGTVQKIKMLCSSEGQYIKGDNEVGVIKPYAGNKFSFVALLPDEGIALNEYINSLSGEEFVSLIENRSYEEVITRIPKFKYEYDHSQMDVLRSIGVSRALNPSAQFGDMGETKTGYLYIGDVLHKTYIELDENGTKAAAVTAVIMKNEGVAVDEKPPKEVILDRPFVFAIIDNSSSLPIFMGTVENFD